jgi:hypothetical protein
VGPGGEGKDGEEPVVVVVVGRCAADASHAATVYCTKCEAAFCDACAASEHSGRVTGRHKRVPLAEAPLLCPLHSGRECDLVCMDPACQAPTEAEPLLPLICERCYFDADRACEPPFFTC